MTEPFDGVVPIDKPAGPTSHDIVAAARRALRTRRIGHTGTLDPFATGLLLLCVGRATRIAEYLTGSDKRYRARVRLGVRTETDDDTGAVLDTRDASAVSRDMVEAALAQQRGRIMQTPPQYSAKKQAGERAYDMARAGVAFTLPAVAVEVYELNIVEFHAPFVELDVHCSSGTYIRALARDIGAALGVGAHLVALRRTAIGNVSVDRGLSLEQLQEREQVQRAVIAPIDALSDMPRLELHSEEVALIRHGRALPGRAQFDGVVALVAAGELVAIAVADAGSIRPRKVFV